MGKGCPGRRTPIGQSFDGFAWLRGNVVSIRSRVIRACGIGDGPEIDGRERTWKPDVGRAAVRERVVRPATVAARARAAMAALLDPFHVVAVALVEIHVIIHVVRL